MANVTTRSDLERPAHTTNGSSRRAARSVSAQGLIYRLGVEIQSLKGDLRQTSRARAAKTLAKANNLRVALITLRSGFTIHPHAIAGGRHAPGSGRAAQNPSGRHRPRNCWE